MTLKNRVDRLEARTRPQATEPRERILDRLNAKLDAMRDRLGPIELTPEEIDETFQLGRELRDRIRANLEGGS